MQFGGKGVVASNKPENINDDVIEVVNDVVENIKRSTRPMLAIDITYNILYSAPGSLKEVLFGLTADMFANGVEDPNHNIICNLCGVGLMHYTIGQRHGLGIGGTKDTEGEAWFACGKDLENNVLYVCQGFHNEKLYSDSLLSKFTIIYNEKSTT